MIEVGSPFWLYMNEETNKKKLKEIANYINNWACTLEEACHMLNINTDSLSANDLKYIKSQLV